MLIKDHSVQVPIGNLLVEQLVALQLKDFEDLQPGRIFYLLFELSLMDQGLIYCHQTNLNNR